MHESPKQSIQNLPPETLHKMSPPLEQSINTHGWQRISLSAVHDIERGWTDMFCWVPVCTEWGYWGRGFWWTCLRIKGWARLEGLFLHVMKLQLLRRFSPFLFFMTFKISEYCASILRLSDCVRFVNRLSEKKKDLIVIYQDYCIYCTNVIYFISKTNMMVFMTSPFCLNFSLKNYEECALLYLPLREGWINPLKDFSIDSNNELNMGISVHKLSPN